MKLAVAASSPTRIGAGQLVCKIWFCTRQGCGGDGTTKDVSRHADCPSGPPELSVEPAFPRVAFNPPKTLLWHTSRTDTTNNFLYDFSQVPIPIDAVDDEQVARPRPWNIDEIKRFILFIGPISSLFDYTTFFVMLWVFNCWDPSRAAVFQTGWFVESLMTQTLIIHVIRTNKIPFIQSRASWPLTVTTLSIMAFGMWLPYSPLAPSLGLVQLPRLYWPILMLTLLGYVSFTQVIKAWLLRKKWI